jgi:ABC-type multidrug transport system fused ATPase/permease subunit
VNWLGAAYLTVQAVARQTTRLGATLAKRLTTGEVVSVGVADISHIGGAMDIAARGMGALVSIVVVAVILLTTSPRLGLVVVLGVPVILLAVVPLLRPLHRRQHAHRELAGELNARATDIVAGLRVLRGIGGEEVFAARYRAESQRVRWAGVGVARAESMLAGGEVLLPGLLIALVTWLGARYALAGTISVGRLVAFYGYAVFLIQPMRTLGEAADKLTKGHVSAGRVIRILAMEPEFAATGTRVPPPAAELSDAASGLVVRPGRFTAIAAAEPADARAIAERLGGYAAGEVTYGGIPLLEIADLRRRVIVAINEDVLFSGPLREVLAPPHRGTTAGTRAPGGPADEAAAGTTGDGHLARPRLAPPDGAGRDPALRDPALRDLALRDLALRDLALGEPALLDLAVHAACAEDVVEAAGLDSHVAEAGREFSGGQQQRLRLARALMADPDVLILVEPTSAVDAHTEARIAERLAKARNAAGAGDRGPGREDRTTVVCTMSPLVLEQADQVVYVENGTVVAEGTHRELLRTHARYASAVTRDQDD